MGSITKVVLLFFGSQLAFSTADQPLSKNYVKMGVVNPIRYQGQCGSSWAFAVISTIESQIALQTGALQQLSEQYLVDCVYANAGCDGGMHTEAFEYIMENGIALAEGYPYTAKQGICNLNAPKTNYKLSSFQKVNPKNDDELLNSLRDVGPIAVAIHASERFLDYKGGVLEDELCTSTSSFNHIVSLVGYGTENGKDYWLIRNSHGRSYGEQGYIKLARNKLNHCRISEHAYFPVIKEMFVNQTHALVAATVGLHRRRRKAQRRGRPGVSRTNMNRGQQRRTRINMENNKAFEDFKKEFNKTYSLEEERYRQQIFNKNVKKIKEHNEKDHSFKLGINQFTDLTHAEFEASYTGGKELNVTSRRGKTLNSYYVPREVKTKGGLSKRVMDYYARDQGSCGSCWAFATVASIEMQIWAIGYTTPYRWRPPLSEQNLVDCVTANHGCDGGWHDEVYDYISDHGISHAKDYPYTAKDGKCKHHGKSRDIYVGYSLGNSYYVHIKEWKQVTPGKDDDVANALEHLGPMTVVIHASENFMFYDGGILDDAHCNDRSHKNHIVSLEGYGSQNGKDYWILRNSHGRRWGEDGYVYLARGNNHCRISEHAYIPILSEPYVK